MRSVMTIFKFEGISNDYFTTFSRYIQMFKIPKKPDCFEVYSDRKTCINSIPRDKSISVFQTSSQFHHKFLENENFHGYPCTTQINFTVIEKMKDDG